jgi:hypothetical protein
VVVELIALIDRRGVPRAVTATFCSTFLHLIISGGFGEASVGREWNVSRPVNPFLGQLDMNSNRCTQRIAYFIEEII